MVHKKIFFLAGVALILAGGYVLFQWQNSTGENNREALYEWELQEIEADAGGTPRTRVILKADGRPYDVGTYIGSCRVIPDGATGALGEMADPGEISRVQCWFAGGGEEIGVFRVDGIVTVRVGELGEGSEEEPPFRGNFKVFNL